VLMISSHSYSTIPVPTSFLLFFLSQKNNAYLGNYKKIKNKIRGRWGGEASFKKIMSECQGNPSIFEHRALTIQKEKTKRAFNFSYFL
jgi:hypothetical protein